MLLVELFNVSDNPLLLQLLRLLRRGPTRPVFNIFNELPIGWAINDMLHGRTGRLVLGSTNCSGGYFNHMF